MALGSVQLRITRQGSIRKRQRQRALVSILVAQMSSQHRRGKRGH
jgi:hypothetical protein